MWLSSVNIFANTSPEFAAEGRRPIFPFSSGPVNGGNVKLSWNLCYESCSRQLTKRNESPPIANLSLLFFFSSGVRIYPRIPPPPQHPRGPLQGTWALHRPIAWPPRPLTFIIPCPCHHLPARRRVYRRLDCVSAIRESRFSMHRSRPLTSLFF